MDELVTAMRDLVDQYREMLDIMRGMVDQQGEAQAIMQENLQDVRLLKAYIGGPQEEQPAE